MTLDEMRSSMEETLKQDKRNPEERNFVVAIGHSKDLVDSNAVRRFLAFLKERSVGVTTFSRFLCEKPALLA